MTGAAVASLPEVRWSELLDGLPVVERTGDDVGVHGLVHDSRAARPGVCFACIPGATTDGHDFAPDAVDRGAVALLVERTLALPVPQAQVASVRAALGPLAARLWGEPSRAMQCFGVTGTNGKTTTTYLLEAIVGAAGMVPAVVGTTGVRVAGRVRAIDRTTPEADELHALLAELRDGGVTTVAMEVSSHALVQHRVDGVWFAATCFTNLSHDHLDYHGDLETYFAAKLELFSPVRTSTVATNVDDRFGARVALESTARGLEVWTYAIDDVSADVGVRDLQMTLDGSSFVLVDRRGGREALVATRAMGAFNVANVLAAGTTALASGVAFADVVAGLATPVVVPGRAEPVVAGQPFTVVVDYAHTPDALDRVLDAAREVAGDGRVLVVFGCGGDRDREKRPLMGAAAVRHAHVAVLTSDNPRSEAPDAIAADVLRGVRDAGGDVVVELDRRAAIRVAFELAHPGDVVVIAGKGHETGQTAAGRTIPFDDRQVAREELEGLGWT